MQSDARCGFTNGLESMVKVGVCKDWGSTEQRPAATLERSRRMGLDEASSTQIAPCCVDYFAAPR
jgi:hypothetical protein